MMSKQAAKNLANSTTNSFLGMSQAMGPVGEYLTDTMQRTVLFWDLMRQRSEQYYSQKEKAVPHVLSFDAELVLDARTFERPANYLLVRVKPPAGVVIDPLKRPFVVVDPRAGHGPGIGGFKADSELGVAMRAGHPCYFVGFTPEPMPGQTIEDITLAEAIFLEKVIALHPDAEGKPCIIGNCQAGWAVMMLAALRPELCGPVIVPGSPLSYWAGIEGENPMRYTGGLAGGSWITALTSDLGNGKFDGAHLVKNFENLNPANTLWGKNYDIWSTIDNGAERFLEFEKWWGGHVNLNGEEIQWIVDQLFVGNKLATGEIITRDGVRIDLRNIRSPIICFCSKGDNITPPQQALGWIADLYAKDDDIRACGQTIIYAIHENVGHLGIFVSGGIAKKEHQEFASNIDLIDVLPPGLYEAVMTAKTGESANADLISGDWIVRFEPRTLDNIRAIVRPNLENERRFATVKRVSEINLSLYRTLLQPLLQATMNEQTTGLMKQINPSDLPFALFSDRNPLMKQVAQLAEQVRQERQPVAQDNPLLQWQTAISEGIVAALDGYRDLRDKTLEQIFLTTYSSPLLQSLVGLSASDEPPRKRPGFDPERLAFIEKRIGELKARIAEGGLREAAIRSLIYIGMAGEGVDERAFNQLRNIRAENCGISLEAFKQILREQFFGLQLDRAAAMAAIPKMLPADQSQRNQALEAIRRTVEASGKLSGERAKRLAEIEKLFAAGEAKVATTPKAPAKSKTPAKPKAAAEPKAPAKRAPRKAV
jgi:pimeloyl-ACP methyl ester carboxylesterase